MEIQKEFQKIHKEFSKIHKRFDEVDKHFEQVDKRFDEQDAKFATKDDLRAQTKELKEYADQQTAFLAGIIKDDISDPLKEHLQSTEIHGGLKNRVDHLEKTLLVK